MSEYWQKLKSPMWQKKRLEIMKRDNFTCVSCGDNQNTLNVHHKTYRKGASPWDYDDSLLITLCEECHYNMHVSKDLLINSIDTLWKMNRLADLSRFCSDEHIKYTQLFCVFEYLEKHKDIPTKHYKGYGELAAKLSKRCQEFIKYTKKQIKEGDKTK